MGSYCFWCGSGWHRCRHWRHFLDCTTSCELVAGFLSNFHGCLDSKDLIRFLWHWSNIQGQISRKTDSFARGHPFFLKLLLHISSGDFIVISLHLLAIHRPSVHTFEQLLWVSVFFKFLLEPFDNGGLKICTNGLSLLIKIVAMPIYGKNTYKSSSPKARKLQGLLLVHVYSIRDLRSTNLVQMTLGWYLAFLQQGQIYIPIHLFGENIEKFSISKCINDNWLKLTMYDQSNKYTLSVTIKILSPWFICPCTWAIYMYKIL